MISLPYEEVVNKICGETKLSRVVIEDKIRDKMETLSGLISKEGAAYIIANEYGIKLFDQVSGRLQIKNVLAGMRNVEVVGKVVAVFDVNEFENEKGKGKVGSFIIGDETGTIRAVLWHDMTSNLANIKKGDVVRLTSAYARESNGRKELHLSQYSKLDINPENETVETSMKIERKQIKDLVDGEQNIELLGTIVQVFDIRFFETCSSCNKRLKQGEEGLVCAAHGKTDPNYGYVLNLILDDGSENIRIVLWREQVNQLLNAEYSQVLNFKDNVDGFAKNKTELLGEIIKLTGRVQRNSLFDRLEVIANNVEKANPEEELKRVEAQIS